MAKDFKAINTARQETGVNTGEVFAIAEKGKDRYKQQGTASEQEQRERAAEMRTQGRKGCKAPRVNLAFSSENYDYAHTVSRVTGQTLTKFLNDIIAQHRKSHQEIYQQAKAMLSSMEGGGQYGK